MIIIQRPGESNNDNVLDFFKPGRRAERSYTTYDISNGATVRDGIFANKPCTIVISDHYAVGKPVFLRMCYIPMNSNSAPQYQPLDANDGTVTPLVSIALNDFQTPYAVKLSNVADKANNRLYGIFVASNITAVPNGTVDVNSVAHVVAYPDDGNVQDLQVRYVTLTPNSLTTFDWNSLKELYNSIQ